MDQDAVDSEQIGDDELAALAVAADPDQPLDPDAVPFVADPDRQGLLPAWYMPAPAVRNGGRTRRLVIAGIVLALLIVNGAGLCVTYGFPEIAW